MSRIAIVTGRIAPGTDGVGDYTRSLGEELARMGHESLIIGLNQNSSAYPWVRRIGGEAVQPFSPPPAESRQDRIEASRLIVQEFDPEVISFQYVSYAFARRGLAVNIGRAFRRIAGNRRVDLNAHELWSGFDESASIRERVQGYLQYRLFLRFLRHLEPDTIHVSNPTYVELMRQIGRKARLSLLFGNVPVTDAMPAPGTEGFEETAANVRRFLIFGTIHAEWPPEPLMTRLTGLAAREGFEPVIISAGRIGPGLPVWNRMIETHGSHCRFVRLGERSAAEISALINGADIGISTSPMCLIGKSGTVAAMLEHGMPVIVNREHSLRYVPNIEPAEGYARFIRIDDQFEEALLAAFDTPRVRASRLPGAARQFLDDAGIGS